MATVDRQNLRRLASLLVAAIALSTLVAARPAAANPPSPRNWAAWDLGPGVQELLTERPGLVAHAARVKAGAPVALQPVVAHDRVGGGHAPNAGRQPTTELCSRVGGIVCVNADFFNCPTCGQVAGGLVDKGRPLRSGQLRYPQISVVDERLTLDTLRWVGTVRATAGPLTVDVPLASLNRGPARDAMVLYTPEWGPSTPQQPGQLEVVLSTGGPLVPGRQPAVPVARRPGSGGIPRDGVVLSANGRAAVLLNQLWDAWHANAGGPRRFEFDTALSFPAKLSVGGRPVLLRDGVRMALDPRDTMVTRRHPRTLLGWTRTGDLLLVTIDGRRPGYSNGATLAEATDLLLELGAVDGVNLDGGGSSTFVKRCAGGTCVRNRPSDGRERPVALALAVVPVGPSRAATLAAAAAEPTPPSTTTTTVAPPSTTVVPATTTTTTTKAPTAPVAPTAPARSLGSALPLAASAPPATGDRHPGPWALSAVAALIAVAVATARSLSRR